MSLPTRTDKTRDKYMRPSIRLLAACAVVVPAAAAFAQQPGAQQSSPAVQPAASPHPAAAVLGVWSAVPECGLTDPRVVVTLHNIELSLSSGSERYEVTAYRQVPEGVAAVISGLRSLPATAEGGPPRVRWVRDEPNESARGTTVLMRRDGETLRFVGLRRPDGEPRDFGDAAFDLTYRSCL